ncbi:MAG: hypothetical protein EBS01_15810 [Verrucomicrobia bacterium]|nr:hypothetical protein [Verrucomicrobiota bacterium]
MKFSMSGILGDAGDRHECHSDKGRLSGRLSWGFYANKKRVPHRHRKKAPQLSAIRDRHVSLLFPQTEQKMGVRTDGADIKVFSC